MTIPDDIKAAYQQWRQVALAPDLCDALRWAVAQAMRFEYLCELKSHSSAYNKPERDWKPADWLTEAEAKLMEPVKEAK